MRVIPLYTNEKKLISKAVLGHRKAQKHLYDRYASRMLSICRQYVSPVETAEELMLNGFFKAFTKLDTFTHTGSFEGWLKRIMVRECIDYLRKKDPFRYSTELTENQLPNDSSEPSTDDLPLDQLQQAIDGIPSGYRSVFVMIAIDGFKHKEVAQIQGISENTSKSQYRKARLMLQERVMYLRQQRNEA